MNVVEFNIKTATEQLNDDAVELFFRFLMDRNKREIRNIGAAAWRLNQKPKIEKGETYIEYLFELEGEYYPSNYGLLGFKFCYTYGILPEFFKADHFDLTPLIEISKIYLPNCKRYETKIIN